MPHTLRRSGQRGGAVVQPRHHNKLPTLTVPAMFRTTFYQTAAVVLSAFMRCGVQCLDDFYSTVKGKPLKGGYIVVLHTHGRTGQYHPHLHLLATSGGYDGPGECWEHL